MLKTIVLNNLISVYFYFILVYNCVMMNISLNTHPEKYHLGVIDLCVCCLTLFTALPFARRHVEQADKYDEATWAHRILAVVECMPILGAIVALIEYCICSRHIWIRPLFEIPFQSAQSVTEFQQLPETQQRRLEKTAFKMLKATVSQAHHPQELRGTGIFSADYYGYRDMAQNCSPEEFVQKLKEDKNNRGASKSWWAETYNGQSALHLAIHSGRPELIRHVLDIQKAKQPSLLNKGSEVRLITPLLKAISTNFVSSQANREEIVELLLENEANPNLYDFNRSTPLFAAIETGQIALIRRLLLHENATLCFPLAFDRVENGIMILRDGDEPQPNLSEQGRAALLITYRQIESALREGLHLVVAHTDLHSIIAGYYWRSG